MQDSPHQIDQDTLDELIFDALEIPQERRIDWLQARCGDNTALFDEALSLAKAHSASGDFLFQSIATQDNCVGIAELGDYANKQVGPWMLERCIGEGGMGAVYLAHRADGAYNQTVAVKLTAGSPLRNALFNRERQSLADLNHPVITRIIDGGALANGEGEYLAMEYIDGVPITHYTRTHNTPIKEKLKLVVSLLDALGAAHQQGIIHCDIKPDNVLVQEGELLKLLDFGISRAIAEEREDTHATITYHGLTPRYASPQRIQGITPTVSDDIYSVGLLLAELLLHSDHQTQDRQSMLNALSSSPIPSDLTAIVKRATATSPASRYGSAYEFQADIQQYLANKPVAAFNGGAAYRLKKWSRREWPMLLLAMFAILVAIASGIAWLKHERALQVEHRQQQQVDAALSMITDMNNSLDLKLSHVEGTLIARLAAAQSTLNQIERIHAEQPDNAEIQHVLGQAYLKVGELYFRPAGLHVNEIAKGRELLRDGYNIIYDTFVQTPNAKHLEALIVATRRSTSNLMIVENDWNSALPYWDNLADVATTIDMPKAARAKVRRSNSIVLFRIHLLNGDYQQAKALLDQVIPKNVPDFSKMSDVEANSFKSNINRLKEFEGIYDMVTGDYAQAKVHFEQVIKQFSTSRIWNNRRRALYAHRSIACMTLLEDQANTASALSHLQSAKQHAQKLVSAHPKAAGLHWELDALSGVEQFAAQLTSQSKLTTEQMLGWQQQFNCNNLGFLHMPAPPPGGWEKVKEAMPFTAREYLKLVQ